MTAFISDLKIDHFDQFKKMSMLIKHCSLFFAKVSAFFGEK
jgi:hypothetical protein